MPMFSDPWFSAAVLVARVLLATVYLASAVEKGLHFPRALEEFARARVPLLRPTTAATIALHFVAAICLMAGLLVTEMALALALFTVVATIRVHDFWNMEGLQRLERSRIALANFGLVGGLILLAAVGPGSYVI